MEYPPETGWGGIGASLASIGPGLVARGHEVHLLSCVDGQEHRDYTDREVYIHRRGGLPGSRPPLSYIFKLLGWPESVGRIRLALATYYWYRRLSRRYQFDIVEYPDWCAEGLLLSSLTRMPTVAHLHTPLPVIAKYHDLPITPDRKIASFLESIAVRNASCITAPSSEVIRELPDNWLRGRGVAIIPYAVDWQRWRDVPAVATTERRVILVGRLERLKMPEVLVQAMHQLASKLADAEALFVGSGNGERDGLPYERWLQTFAATTSARCHFLGKVPRPELPRIIAQARVAVSASSYDNFPMAVLEAMASGRPVVVTATNGIAPLIHEHQAGNVVPVGDASALAAALRPYLEDAAYAAEVGRRGQALVREQLDPEHIASLREKVYRRALSEGEQRIPAEKHFPYALSKTVGGFRFPEKWRVVMAGQAAVEPWKHFYLRTGEHLLRLLASYPGLGNRGDLHGVRLLDIGCTPALDALLACLGAEVTMVDCAADELHKGMRLGEQLEVSQLLHPVLADAFKLPFQPQSYDVVWNSGFIEHFEDPVALIRLMAGHCRPGGAVLVLVPNRWTPHSLWIRERQRRRGAYYWDFMGKEKSYSQRELAQMCTLAGVKVIAHSALNLRRSMVDDIAVMSRLGSPRRRRLLQAAMNFTDWLEQKVPATRRWGFMVGAVGIVQGTATTLES